MPHHHPRKIVAVVQARMNSARLPGKSLIDIKGKPSLAYLIESIEQCIPREDICVATSSNEPDKAIEEFCQMTRLKCYRGREDNVASRFLEIGALYSASHLIRISGDSPLLDWRIIETAVNSLAQGDFDLITTVSPDSFPSGMNVELMKYQAFEMAYHNFSSPEHFEHVTPYFYEHKADWNICALGSSIPNGKRYKFSLDTREDLKRILTLVDHLPEPHYHYSLKEKCIVYTKLFPE